MLESIWLFTGGVAAAATAAAVLTNDNGVAIVTGVLGFVAWGVWTFGSLNVEVMSNGAITTFSSPAATLLGVALALIPGYIAFTGPVELFARSRNTQLDDV